MWTLEAAEWLETAVVRWKRDIDMHTKPHRNVTEKLQPHVSNYQLLYLHPLNFLTLPILNSSPFSLKVFSSAPDLVFGVINIKDAPLIHVLEEVESLATEGQVHHVIQPPNTLLFIELELLQFPQFLLHKTFPSDSPAISSCSHIQLHFVSHPSSDSSRAPCLSVNAERRYFLEDRWSRVVVVFSWLDTVVVSTCSMSVLPTGHGCGS